MKEDNFKFKKISDLHEKITMKRIEEIYKISISITDVEVSNHSEDISDISLYILEIIQG